MSEYFINKAKTCAVTGHRRLPKDFNSANLGQAILELIDKGFDTFLVGMAVGFDTECFKILEIARKAFGVKIIACIPCENQAERFSERQKEEYYRMTRVADQKILLSKEYTNDCMMKRNRFMVDNCSCLLAYLTQNYGGTASTVRYAEKQGVNVVFVK